MKKLFSLLLGACTVFAACTDDVENIRQDGSTKLAVNVKVNPTSRAMVHGIALPGGSSIGINVTDATGNPYDGKDAGYLNVQYTATGEAGAQTWAPATDAVLLSGTEGKMHAYYPWTAGIDYKAVTVDVADQIDWMYAADAYSVSDAKNAHEIVLSHAQTAVNVNLVRDASYTGVGAVEALTVTSEGLASTASLDTRNGSFASVTGVNTAISIIEAPYTLDGSTLSSQENPYMFIPASAETKDFTVSATLDGKAYSHKVTMAEAFASGKVYKINVTFKNTGLEVSTVTLVDWTETELGDAEFEPYDPLAKYADWVKLTYNVTDASLPVDIFCPQEYSGIKTFDIASVEEMAVLEDDGSRAVGEPVKVTPSLTYQFSTTGIHTVYVKFADMAIIPQEAFYRCEGLTTVTIPNSVQTIGDRVFRSCTGLTEVTIGSAVQTIGTSAFWQCTGLTEVTIGSAVKTIGETAFWGCTGIRYLTIGSNVQTIGMAAFQECSGLTGTLTISNSVQTIGQAAFDHCSGLTSVTIGSAVTTIGEWAFRGCTGLTGELVIPNSVTEIVEAAFQECEGLTSVTIPNSVQTIGERAFQDCLGLTEVTIEAQTIGEWAFDGCTGLTEVTIGSAVTTIGEMAFQYCNELKKITSYAMIAPSIHVSTFWGVKDSGKLYYPEGSDYSTWTANLSGWGWTTQEFTGQ